MEFAKYAVFKVETLIMKGIIINAVLNLLKNFTVNLKVCEYDRRGIP